MDREESVRDFILEEINQAYKRGARKALITLGLSIKSEDKKEYTKSEILVKIKTLIEGI